MQSKNKTPDLPSGVKEKQQHPEIDFIKSNLDSGISQSFSEIPDELIVIDKWSVHKDKIPEANGSGIMHLSLADAIAYMDQHNGSGLAFDFKGTPYAYTDLDTYEKHADVALHQHLVELARNDTYVEQSLNGGTHIVFKGERFAGGKKVAIDNRDSNLLYITGNSIGLPTIGTLSDEFIKVSGFKPASEVTYAQQSVGDTNRGNRTPGQCRDHFNNLSKDITPDKFESRSEHAFALMNYARYATDNDVELMVSLVDKVMEPLNYDHKRTYGDALRCIEKTDDIDNTYFSNGEPEPGILSALKRGSEIAEKGIDWKWRPWLAGGKFNLMAARGGSAKTTLELDVAARITVGGLTPDNTDRFDIGTVLFVTNEDDPDDTLLPRFRLAGGDPEKIIFLSSPKYHLNFDEHPEQYAEILEAYPEITFAILDPVTSMTGDANTHMDSNVKRIAGEIASISNHYGVCTNGIMHFRKGDPAQEKNFVDMITGSAGWVNSARTVTACFLDEETNVGYWGIVKSNIGPKNYMLEYSVQIHGEDTASQIISIDYSDLKRDFIAKVVNEKFGKKAAASDGPSQKDADINDAFHLIFKYFVDNGPDPAPADDVYKYVRMKIGRSISNDSLFRAEKETELHKGPIEKGGKWHLHSLDCICDNCGE